jgi:hypothetical protein
VAVGRDPVRCPEGLEGTEASHLERKQHRVRVLMHHIFSVFCFIPWIHLLLTSSIDRYRFVLRAFAFTHGTRWIDALLI